MGGCYFQSMQKLMLQNISANYSKSNKFFFSLKTSNLFCFSLKLMMPFTACPEQVRIFFYFTALKNKTKPTPKTTLSMKCYRITTNFQGFLHLQVEYFVFEEENKLFLLFGVKLTLVQMTI